MRDTVSRTHRPTFARARTCERRRTDPRYRMRHRNRRVRSRRRGGRDGLRRRDRPMHLFESLGFERAARRVLWRWYRGRGLAVQMRMLLAPHEVLLVRTFTDLPPASPQEVSPAS